MSRVFKFALVLLVLVFGVAFHLRNDQFVTLDYYVNSISLPFSMWVFIWVALGACLGLVANLPLLLRIKRENARLQKQRRAQEEEMKNLKASAVKDGL